MSEDLTQTIQAFKLRVDELLALVERLRSENHALLRQQEHLNDERARLIEKNEQARTRVEAMISRLKSMESST